MRTKLLPSRRGAEARNEMALRHLRLVGRVVRSLWGWSLVRRLGMEEAYQEGYLGLLRACELYDETRGFAESTYLCWAIRRRVAAAAKRQRLVALPKDGEVTDRNRSDYERAARLVPAGGDLHAGRAGPAELLDDGGAASAAAERAQHIEDLRLRVGPLVDALPPRERLAVRMRFWEGTTWEEVGRALGVSKEGARQRAEKGLKLLHRAMAAGAFKARGWGA